ncbi:S8 family serine peptidase [Actinomyces bovis]|uniref:S8 family serine peptidase n=1 Tax=Actinomyces bovis TaxID=1658 RepID=UPI000F82CB26|nr:S8 family serine peptidase [Actinomyces bovis]
MGGYDLVGDDYTSDSDTMPKADALPDDCGGHGTHVAGIAAGKKPANATDGITGAAPDATIRAYRVFGCQSGTSSEIIAEAMQRAYEDKVDVVNLSLGTDYIVFTGYPTAVAATTLAERGVIVSAAQGNFGAGDPDIPGSGGRWTMGGPSSGSPVISSGSVNNSAFTDFYLAISTKADARLAYALGVGTTGVILRGKGETWQVAEAGPLPAGADQDKLADSDPALLCSAPAKDTFKGKAVLARRGGCDVHKKATNAEAGGATLLVVDNSTDGLELLNAANPDTKAPVSIPLVSITREGGDDLRKALKADAATTISFPRDHADFKWKAAGKLSEFSSWGLNSELELKPEIAAPGGGIWSTWPLEDSGYKNNSGTSMSAPYTAGVIAMLLESHPEILQASGLERTRQVTWRLQSTAKPVKARDGSDSLEAMALQGAGLIDAKAAIDATVEIAPSVLNLGQSADVAGLTQQVKLTNHGSASVTYTLGHRDSQTITGPSGSPQVAAAGEIGVSTDGKSVTIGAGQSTTLEIKITPPSKIKDGDFYGGFIVFTKSDGTSIHLPFSGVGGDMAKTDLLNGNEPKILNTTKEPVEPGSYIFGKSPAAPNGMYNDSAYMLFMLDIPVTKVVADVIPEGQDQPLGMSLAQVLADDGLQKIADQINKGQIISDPLRPTLGKFDLSIYPRSTPSAFRWDGSYVGTDYRRHQVPNGKYKVVLHMLPVGEDGKEVADWQAWTSPALSVDWATDGYLPQSELSLVGGTDADKAVLDDDAFTAAEAAKGQNSWVVDLGQTRELKQVAVTPEQVVDSKVFTKVLGEWSVDGQNWTQFAELAWDKPENHEQAILKAPAGVNARYVRVTASNTQKDSANTVVGEIRVAAGSGSVAPTPEASPAPETSPAPEASPTPLTPAPGDSKSAEEGKNTPGKNNRKSLSVTGVSFTLVLLAGGLLATGAVVMYRRRHAEA